ncbi:proton-coupled amino acid transporter-like protein CG1139 [Uranotaenia lowii]|uniref:proton-coupled amino acid transporter-like protein CG1139 n=1 Tax=Uranotaenia lowii TaxID=190385 RepID=UPI00247B0EC9|nr:proton-coupled amino acid transporter-like protein CG1139 [Uranotaenia lowii]
MSASVESLHRKDDEEDYNPFEHRDVEKPNSTLGTLMHVIKGSLGTGIMAMPMIIKNGGLIFGTVGTIVICGLYAHCVHLLVNVSQKACRRSRIPKLGFSETAVDVFSKGPPAVRPFAKYFSRMIDVMILVHSMLSFSLYLIFSAKSFQDVIFNQQGIDWDTRIYILMILVPVIFITQVRVLKYLVPFSVVSSTLIMASIGITFYFIFSEPISLKGRNLWPQWSTLPAFSSGALFAIQGIKYILPVENDMKHPEHMRSPLGVINSAISFLTILYSIMGFVGYAQYGEEVKGSVTLNLPSNSTLAESTRVLSATAMIVTLGLSFYVPMQIVWEQVKQRFSPKHHNLAQICLRFVIVIVLAGIAIGAPEIEPFVGLVGSLSSSILGVIVPATIDLVFRWPNGLGLLKWRLFKDTILLLFGTFVCVVGTYFSILDIVAIYK